MYPEGAPQQRTGGDGHGGHQPAAAPKGGDSLRLVQLTAVSVPQPACSVEEGAAEAGGVYLAASGHRERVIRAARELADSDAGKCIDLRRRQSARRGAQRPWAPGATSLAGASGAQPASPSARSAGRCSGLRRLTLAGVCALVLDEPRPSCPDDPSPHAYTSPSTATAAEWCLPQATCAIRTPSRPDTGTGTSRSCKSPRPSLWPSAVPQIWRMPEIAGGALGADDSARTADRSDPIAVSRHCAYN